MSKLLLLAVAVGLLATTSEARVRAVRPPGAFPAPRSVMWIAAHPDDEAVAAPLLAKWCREDEARCSFLVLTRGEAGTCALSGGCVPDVRSVRSSEAGAASELFHAESVLLRYPDGGGVLAPRWDAVTGDSPDLVSRITAHIEAFKPELILTFDPRHGTTCHPDHRETGRLVLEAVRRLTVAPMLYFLETRVAFANDPLTITFSAATQAAERFDATQLLPYAGAEAWEAIVWDMERHPSQFPHALMTAIENVPPSARAIFIAPAETILEQDVSPCP